MGYGQIYKLAAWHLVPRYELVDLPYFISYILYVFKTLFGDFAFVDRLQ